MPRTNQRNHPAKIEWKACECLGTNEEPDGFGTLFLDVGGKPELYHYQPAPLATGEADAYRLQSVDGGLLVTAYAGEVRCTCDLYRTLHGPRGERCRHGQALLELGLLKLRGRAKQKQKQNA